MTDKLQKWLPSAVSLSIVVGTSYVLRLSTLRDGYYTLLMSLLAALSSSPVVKALLKPRIGTELRRRRAARSLLSRACGDEDLVTAERVFCLLELLLPKRLCKEDLGDAREVIAGLIQRRCPKWQVRLKLVSAIFWSSLNGVREIVTTVSRKSSNR